MINVRPRQNNRSRSVESPELRQQITKVVQKMDTINCQHQRLAGGDWAKLPFCLQMGNVGSEVSRSLKWFGKNEKRFNSAFDRALELFDLTIEGALGYDGRLKEVCRAREEFCDYFLGNSWGTDPEKMMRYYDQFAILGRGL